MHGDLLAQLGRLRGVALERDQHADLAHVRRGGVVHVGHDRALAHRKRLHPAQCLLLADGGDVVGFGDPDQRGGHLLDLGDAPGHPVDAGGGQGLHRVDHQHRRVYLLNMRQRRSQISF